MMVNGDVGIPPQLFLFSIIQEGGGARHWRGWRGEALMEVEGGCIGGVGGERF